MGSRAEMIGASHSSERSPRGIRVWRKKLSKRSNALCLRGIDDVECGCDKELAGSGVPVIDSPMPFRGTEPPQHTVHEPFGVLDGEIAGADADVGETRSPRSCRRPH